MRGYKKLFVSLLKILAKRMPDPASICFALDHDATGYRLYLATDRSVYERSISPRLGPREMRIWLEGMIAGIEEYERKR